MGTETKINCYTQNNTSNGGIPKVSKGPASTANRSNVAPTSTTAPANGQHSHGNGRHSNGPVSNGHSCQPRHHHHLHHLHQHHHSQNAANQQETTATTTTTTSSSSVPNVPVFIDEHNVIDGAKEILKVIRPHWNLNAVEFKKFTDGITNKLVGCFYNNDDVDVDDNNDSGNLSDSGSDTEASPNNVVLVRVYGNKTDLLIDRKAETRNILLLHSYGFAPSLYATFKNGLAYDYLPGVTLNTTNVLQPKVWGLVARRMADMHRCVQTTEHRQQGGATLPVPMLWRKTQSFLHLVPETFSDPAKQRRLQGTFLPIARIRNEFETLYKRLEALASPIVFAHNDLLLGNVVYTEARNTVNFIDYEYADYNFQAFDIGNHFSEFAGVDEVDYARYPGRDFQLAWLRVYLQSYLQRSHVSDAEVERLYVQVNQFALASHIFWVIWALIQAEHSKIDFDYVEYAFLRYTEYLKRKEEFLALHIDAAN